MGFKFSHNVFAELHAMKNRVDEIVEKSLMDIDKERRSRSNTYDPNTDVFETNQGFVIQMEVPGVDKDDISIEVKDGELYIYGEKKLVKDTSCQTYILLERSYGPFRRVFSLPQTVDEDGIKATLEQGVLTIKIPKKELKKEEIKIRVEVE